MLVALRMILIGAPLNDVLTSIVRSVEAHGGMVGTIMLLDDDGLHLRYGAAPSVPDSLRAATDGVAIGRDLGSCAAAAFCREPVFVADIRTDPKWAGFRDSVLTTELRSAWSSPILSQDSSVLGTYGMYYRDVRVPDASDVQLIESASRVAAVAIESYRSRAALQAAFEEVKESKGR